jgi:hypothetical protein
MDATTTPDLGITDLESLLAHAAEALSGEREFHYILNGRAVSFTYTVRPDSSLLIGVRERAGELSRIKPETMPPAWRPYVGSGISPDLATRIAWAEKSEVKLAGRLLSQLDLFKLSAQVGTLFVLLTEEIAMAATGALHRGEVEVIEALGEGLPVTTTDSSS